MTIDRTWIARLGFVVLLSVGASPVSGQAVGEAGGLLTLEGAVREALDRNRELQTARYQLEEASEQVTEAWGGLYPTLDLSATYTRNITPAVNFVPAQIFDPTAEPDDLVPLQFGADNVWNLSVNAEQVLFKPAVFVAVGAAGRFESLQEEVVRGSTLQVVTGVRTAYYDLLLAQEQERLTEKSVERVRESLEETRALNRAGFSSDYDVLRLEVELANLEPNLLRARNAVQNAKRQLALALDRDDAETLTVAGSLASMDLEVVESNSEENRSILLFAGAELPDDLSGGSALVAAPMATGGGDPVSGLISSAFDNRSDVRQLELTESLRKTEMRLEQVEYLPELSLFGTYGINSSQNGDPDFFGDPRAYTRLVGVQFTLPIFEGFQRDARIDQRRAALRAAETQTALIKDMAASEVRTLVDQVLEARARAQGQRAAVAQAQRGFDIARAQFREGLGSQLELTDSEVALRQSEFNYAQAVYDFLTARARLDEATGLVPGVRDHAEDGGE